MGGDGSDFFRNLDFLILGRGCWEKDGGREQFPDLPGIQVESRGKDKFNQKYSILYFQPGF